MKKISISLNRGEANALMESVQLIVLGYFKPQVNSVFTDELPLLEWWYDNRKKYDRFDTDETFKYNFRLSESYAIRDAIFKSSASEENAYRFVALMQKLDEAMNAESTTFLTQMRKVADLHEYHTNLAREVHDA